MSIQKEFKKRFNCQVKPQSDLAPIIEAEEYGCLTEIKNAIGLVQGNHSKEEFIQSNIWIYRIHWNDNIDKIQISCYSYDSGITYEGGNQ